MKNSLLIFMLVALFTLLACNDSNPPPVNIEPPAPVMEVEPPPTAPVEENISPIATPNKDEPPLEGTVSVSVSLTVPVDTPENSAIFISGDFENWTGGSNPDFALQLQSDGKYLLRFDVDAGSTLLFKFTRGAWDSVEVNELGRDIPNRVKALAEDDIQLSLVVENWKDLTDVQDNPETGFWDTPTPDFSTNNDRPVLTLNGEQTILVPLGGTYEELGATANDPQDGDISNQITTTEDIRLGASGDYLVRYEVADSHGNQAIALTRIIRVIGDTPTPYSLRVVGASNSHLGYVEQLPRQYGEDVEKRFPLLIYHHGGGGDAASLDETRYNSINVFTLSGGPATLANNGVWNSDSQLIALTPQRSVLLNPSIERMNAFVDYAIANYQVDPTRIYMMGFSQGGLVSLRYAVNYPDKVAAIVPIASGFFNGIPDNVCNTSPVPVWAFHSNDDNVVSLNIGEQAVNAINGCNPVELARLTVFTGFGHQVRNHVVSLNGYQDALPSHDPFEENLYLWMMGKSAENR